MNATRRFTAISSTTGAARVRAVAGRVSAMRIACEVVRTKGLRDGNAVHNNALY